MRSINFFKNLVVAWSMLCVVLMLCVIYDGSNPPDPKPHTIDCFAVLFLALICAKLYFPKDNE